MNTRDEKKRLASLNKYSVLDKQEEAIFDQLTKLASIICETPISLISLIDEDRQWFKSHIGLDTRETPRHMAFCNHAIKGDGAFIVEDAREDERFAANPLVTGDPNIKFYAGYPLNSREGEKLGTLCVIDQKPKKLTEMQVSALKTLSEAVQSLLENRRYKIEVENLQKMIPMCAWCKKIRIEDEDDSHWLSWEELQTRVGSITHGICPTCKEKAIE